MISLYIHIPFCARKCDYCAFYSVVSDEKLYDDYTDAVIRQINSFPKKENVYTVYFGGGTPSIIGAKRLSKIFDALKNRFDLSNCIERTLEVNPKTTSLEDLTFLKEIGFNRLSIGLQSSNDQILQEIGRIHTYSDFQETYNNARIAGFSNISVDIMYGLPYQSSLDLIETINKVCDLDAEHISVYGLTLEEGTKMFTYRNSYDFPDEDEEFDMYLLTSNHLEKHGYDHYEISNFSKKGFESKHNIGYWTRREYISFGPSAHSFYCNKRFFCELNLNEFINRSNTTSDYFEYTDFYQTNELTVDESNEEKIMLSLRLKQGAFLEDKLLSKARLYVNSGYMKEDNGYFSFTPAGWYVSNTIISNLLME